MPNRVIEIAASVVFVEALRQAGLRRRRKPSFPAIPGSADLFPGSAVEIPGSQATGIYRQVIDLPFVYR